MYMENIEIKKIYFDMDGVLADFDRGIREICGLVPIAQDAPDRSAAMEDVMWGKVKDAGHFYDMLEPISGSKEMFDAVYEKYGNRCEILTGVPRPKRGIDTASEDKVKWMRRLFSKDIKINTVLRAEKKNFCTGKDCVLIDDFSKNIREWNEMGGTGILFINPEDTIRSLKEKGIL